MWKASFLDKTKKNWEKKENRALNSGAFSSVFVVAWIFSIVKGFSLLGLLFLVLLLLLFETLER